MPHIYKITSPTGKVYVGSSVNVKIRFRKYKTMHATGQIRLYKSFLKYGIDNHIFEVIEECTVENMYLREAFFGSLYDVLGERGLNCRLPKSEDTYKTVNDETRAKISASNKGKRMSDESIEKMRKTKTGQKLSPESIRKSALGRMGKPGGMRGKKHTEETKAKMSANNKGKGHDSEWRDKISKANKGRVFSAEMRAKMKESKRLTKLQQQQDIDKKSA